MTKNFFSKIPNLFAIGFISIVAPAAFIVNSLTKQNDFSLKEIVVIVISFLVLVFVIGALLRTKKKDWTLNNIFS